MGSWPTAIDEAASWRRTMQNMSGRPVRPYGRDMALAAMSLNLDGERMPRGDTAGIFRVLRQMVNDGRSERIADDSDLINAKPPCASHTYSTDQPRPFVRPPGFARTGCTGAGSAS